MDTHMKIMLLGIGFVIAGVLILIVVKLKVLRNKEGVKRLGTLSIVEIALGAAMITISFFIK